MSFTTTRALTTIYPLQSKVLPPLMPQPSPSQIPRGENLPQMVDSGWVWTSMYPQKGTQNLYEKFSSEDQ